MPTYRIEIRKTVLKFLGKQTPSVQKRILSAIGILPQGSDIKKMAGYSCRFRLRVGDIRVIYDRFDDMLVVIVIAIGYRGDVYK
ncbi:MAG TPA: type II toxin-antitoxin system RelE/ParE family toxin [Kiritimatiellia bacterium]|jgi:mRNA interferase RelE/StbE|nr:type II toxin-antitoxin system RelE/ParE family toxin [Kiritimatiellia bacterium]